MKAGIRGRAVGAPWITLVAGVLLTAAGPAAAQTQMTTYEQLQVFSTTLSQIRTSYVDSVRYDRLVRAAIEGMLASLDPHSRFEAHADLMQRLGYEKGELGGVGIDLEQGEGAVVVMSVQDRSPADRAGVQAGDRVRAVDDAPMDGVAPAAIMAQLIGPKGSRVRLGLARGNPLEPDTFTVSMRRVSRDPEFVAGPYEVTPEIALVRLELFWPGAEKQLREAVRKGRSRGARRLIMDLRGNPGGSLTVLDAIAGMFLRKGEAVYDLDGRTARLSSSFQVAEDGEFADMPLAILVDAASASASEILAAAFQDRDRAVIVGRRTFGKAIAQTAFPLPSGDIVWLTTARVRTPSGRFIQRRYDGLASHQYRAAAGHASTLNADSVTYRSANGRPLHGGGGVAPDIAVERAAFPAWFTVAVDSGWTLSMAQQATPGLPAEASGLLAWARSPDDWNGRLLTPLLERVRASLHIGAQLTDGERWRVSRALAYQAAELRWGAEAARQFLLRSDPDVEAARDGLQRLEAVLTPP